MKRLAVVLYALLCSCGCTSDADKDQWAAFWKDLRGDNMTMKMSDDGLVGANRNDSSLKPK